MDITKNKACLISQELEPIDCMKMQEIAADEACCCEISI